jgi:hypothetical protein
MLALPVIWLAELGDDIQSFGPDDPLTWEIRSDPAIDEFFEAWAGEDYADRFEWKHTIDDRSEETPLLERLAGGAWHYLRENIEMAVAPVYPATLGSRVDAVGGIMGSFDQISATEVAPGISKIEVHNDMGWASATRIPGTSRSLLKGTKRRAPGIGGTVTFRFHWYVQIP